MDTYNNHYDPQEKRQSCTSKVFQLIAYKKDHRLVETAQLSCSFVSVNSNMFRGCLHPSPVADLIVGGLRRGSKLKGDNGHETLSHRYLFDANDRLLRIENVHQGKVTYVEDLFYTANSRIGITTYEGKVWNICEEIFEDNHIVSVANMSYYEINDANPLCNLHWEEYKYDEKGLCFCDYVTNFNPDVGLVSRWQYAFVVENGVLKSYATSSGRRYAVTKKRDAQGKGFYFP